MDLKMPVLNGIEASIQIRELNATVPIIAQTGFTSDADKQRTFEAGISDYITKPISRALLLDKIEMALKSSK